VKKEIIKHIIYFFPLMIFFTAVSSFAAMVGMTTDELTKSSDTIITGRVEDVTSRWSSDGKKIITSVSVIPDKVIRGNAVGQKVVLEYDGGEVGDIGMKVSDTPAFKKGENVLLFLKEGKSRVDGAVHNVVGKAQGAYKVDTKGIAKKSGFSAMGRQGVIDNDIPVDVLIEKIKGVR